MTESSKKIERQSPELYQQHKWEGQQNIEQYRDNLIINHIDIPEGITGLRYFPLQKQLTGWSGSGDHIFDIIDGKAERLDDKEHISPKILTFRESICSILKEYGPDSILNDQQQQINQAIFNFRDILSLYEFYTFNVHQNSMIFRRGTRKYVITSFKRARILRTFFVSQLVGQIELSKYMMLFYCKNYKMNLFLNTRSRTKLLRRFSAQTQLISFNGRFLCKQQNLIDVCDMNVRFVIQKYDEASRKPIFINELGLLLIWNLKQLDIFESKSFKMIRSEQLPQQKLTSHIAYDGRRQLLIFSKVNNFYARKVGKQVPEK